MIIKRARGHRLYTTKGEKILDLYMDNGRAVLGHRPNGLSLTLKNSIERGLYANYPNIYLNRLVKDLKKRFPAFTYFAILENEDKLSRIIPNPIDDPLFTDCSNSNIAYWRPFLEVPNTNYLVLLYPFPGLNSVTIVVSKEPLAIENDNISPILLSGIVKSFYEYDMALKEFNPNNYSLFNKINNTILKPPYLIFDLEKKVYDNIVENCLENGIMLNHKLPFAVLPSDFSKGEVQKVTDYLNRRD